MSISPARTRTTGESRAAGGVRGGRAATRRRRDARPVGQVTPIVRRLACDGSARRPAKDPIGVAKVSPTVWGLACDGAHRRLTEDPRRGGLLGPGSSWFGSFPPPRRTTATRAVAVWHRLSFQPHRFRKPDRKTRGGGMGSSASIRPRGDPYPPLPKPAAFRAEVARGPRRRTGGRRTLPPATGQLSDGDVSPGGSSADTTPISEASPRALR